MERSEIYVHTKAAELIGRLTCVLWIYCNAFDCVLNNKPFHIPIEISKEYVAHAEDIINTSYVHSETFSSVSIFDIAFFGRNIAITWPLLHIYVHYFRLSLLKRM